MGFMKYFKANAASEIFASLFLRGKHATRNAVLISLLLLFFWMAKTAIRGIIFIVTYPWNTPHQKHYRLLERVRKIAQESGDTPQNIEKAIRFQNEDWYVLNISSNFWRENVRAISFYVHPSEGKARIFLFTTTDETIEFTYEKLVQVMHLNNQVALTAEHLPIIFSKLRQNHL